MVYIYTIKQKQPFMNKQINQTTFNEYIDGQWDSPIIEGKTFFVNITKRDGTKETIEMPVMREMLAKDTIRWSGHYISQFNLINFLPERWNIYSYSIPTYRP